MTSKLAHDNSETSTLSNSDWLSTSLTSSTLHNCPSFSSLCCQPCSQRFHTNHNAVDLQVPRVDQELQKKKKREKKTSDRHHIDKKAAAEISCSAARASIRGTRSRRAHSSTCLRYKLQACTAHAFTRNVGMHCACVHTNSNLMRGFVANRKSPPPPPPPNGRKKEIESRESKKTAALLVGRLAFR